MILRIAAVIMLIAGLGAFSAYLHKLGKFPTASVAARHMRAMKDRNTAPDTVHATTYEAMAALPKGLSVAEYSGIEMRAVSLEGYVQRMLRAADRDLHLELAPTPQGPVDPPVRYITCEITPQWHGGTKNWRWPELVEVFRPNRGAVTPWESGTRRVRLSGWLMYDYEYEGARTYGPPRLTSWEIHPVTRIERWDDALAQYVEVPR